MKRALITAAAAAALCLGGSALAASPKPSPKPALQKTNAQKAAKAAPRPAKAKPAPAKAAQGQPAAATPAPAAPSAEPALAMADWRELDPENALVIDTNKGRVIVELLPEAAPLHVQRIKELARVGLYDGLVFFRVIDRFMAQTGDPTNTGEGASEQPNLKAEFIFRRDKDTPFATVARPVGLELGFIRSAPIISQSIDYSEVTGDKKVAAWGTYCPGVAGMARDEDNDSANSQFFIMRQAYPSLDKRYTIWGRAVTGVEAVRAIKTGEPVVDPDKMTKVRVLADIPEAERPKVRVIETRGDGFRRLVEKTRAARGADFSICDVELPVQVTEPASTPPPAPAPTPPPAAATPPNTGSGPVA